MKNRSPYDDNISRVLAKIEQQFGDTTPMTPEEERAALARFKAGDMAARDELVRRNMRFISKVALMYVNEKVPFDEMFSEACEGFLVALSRFEPDREFKLISYAVHWIKQRCIVYIRTHTYTVRRPVHISRQRSKVIKAAAQLRNNSDRAVTPEQLAEATGLTVDQVQDALNCESEHSLDLPRHPSSDSDDPQSFKDLLVADNTDTLADLEDADLTHQIQKAIGILPARDQQIIAAFYGFDGDPCTLEEIGTQLGLTRERVRQLRNRALSRLRNHLMPRLPSEVVLREIPIKRQTQIRRMVEEGTDPEDIPFFTGVEADAVERILAA